MSARSQNNVNRDKLCHTGPYIRWFSSGTSVDASGSNIEDRKNLIDCID